MSQSRRHSFVESLANVAVGYGIAVLTQAVVFPWFGIRVPMHDHLAIGALFTVVSIARSYAIRRLFNRWHRNPVKGAS